MRYGSVCSGVGSCRLAAPDSWSGAWFAEIDPFASAVLAHHYPEIPNHGDFTQIGENVGPVDVLVGGTPCQSFSVAGKRAGLDSPNGNLAIEFARLARRVNARWIVWENVPGVLSSRSDDGSNDFDTLLGVLEECGYSLAWRVLDAQYFGVPQRRRRVFVVGYLGDWTASAAVLFERESLSGNPAPLRKTREDVAGTLGGGAGERGWSPDTDRMTFVPELSGCVTPGAHPGSYNGQDAYNDMLVTHSLSSAGNGNTGGGEGMQVRRLTPLECEKLQGLPSGWTLVPYRGKPAADAPRYRAIGNGWAVPVVRWIFERLDAVEGSQR